MNNASQFLSSPFFPHMYPIDLSAEYVINCESIEPCRINLLFTDFLLDMSSIVEVRNCLKLFFTYYINLKAKYG